ncbi:MAG: polysaccharide deacetylase [Oscillospiraceae bacterium]|nr:polysaccharide deacetylase [Oscillospiraceae bacterium]
MEKSNEAVTKYRKHKNTRNFVLAIIAVLMFAALLFTSVYFATYSADENYSAQIYTEIGNAWRKTHAASSSELYKLEEQKRKIQEELLKEQTAALLDEASSDDLQEPDEPEIDYFGVAYLTFDDGPSRSVTAGILDLLAEEDIKATFFVINRVEVEDLYERIIAEGHEIANHSYTHNYNRLYSRGVDAFKEDILRLHDFILETYDYEMTVFRFPGGSASWNRDGIAARREVLSELNYIDFDWHVDSNDAAPSGVDTSAATLTRNVLGNLGAREHVIILMHDYKWRQTTLEALPAIIEGLRELGYRFDIMRNYPQED